MSFILIPLTIGLLDKYEYGVWVTLSTLVLWAYVFDFGLGDGLRNRLAEALATENRRKAREYVSTAYALVAVAAAALLGVFLALSYAVDWYGLLQIDHMRVNNLPQLLRIVMGFFCFTFVGKLCKNVCQGLQLSSVSDMMLFGSNLLSLLAILALRERGGVTLTEAVIALSAAPAVVYGVATAITFIRRRDLSPRLRYVRRGLMRPLVAVSSRIFVADLSRLLIYVAANVVVSRMFGASEVTVYTVALKYFSLIMAVFNVIISPMWSAATDAYTRGDFAWLQSTRRRLLRIWGMLSVAAVVMVAVAGPFYRMWVGEEIDVPTALSAWCAAYASMSMLYDMLAYLVSGCGAMRIYAWSAAAQGALYVPLAIWLSGLIGVAGVPAANCLVLALSLTWAPMQVKMLCSGRASGMWAR